MTDQLIMDRRAFLKSTGSTLGALLVPITLVACDSKQSTLQTDSTDGSVTIGNWLKLDASGIVELWLGKVELGQGIGTAMAQVAAESLAVDFDRIKVMPVDTQYSPDQAYTFSSISVQQSGPAIKKAAAAASHWLKKKAAAELSINVDELRVQDGQFFSDVKDTGLTYWQLVADQQTELPPAKEMPEPAAPTQKVVGQSIPRIDIPGKVFGKSSYLQDLRLDNMLHARIINPPAPRATLDKFDPGVVDNLPGVEKVIRDGNFVAVVALHEHQARQAASKLKQSLQWSLKSDLPEHANIYKWLQSAKAQLEVVAEKTSPEPAVDGGQRFQASYQRPYQCHGSISPSAAVALFENESLTVWSHAQGMYPLRNAIARAVGLPASSVRCLFREAAGCYGHNGADDAACEAAVLAMQMPGRPVRLQWERNDEFLREPLGSAMHIETSATLDDNGRIRNWGYDLWSCPHASRPTSAETAGNLLYAQHREQPLDQPPPRSIPQPNGGSDRNGVPLYDFDALKVTKHLVTDIPLRVSALRGLGAYANVFAIESFMDELAHHANTDPLDFRIQHLKDPRAIAVLEKLGEVSDWANRPAAGNGSGWGIGFAQFKNRASYLGMVYQLEVDAKKSISLKRAIGVCDAGEVINPDGLRAQLEGGIVQSSSWTLKEEMKFNRNKVVSNDWSSYPILRFDEVPEIEIHLMPANGNKSLGVGETAQGPTAAAIANALYHASGQRLRTLPLTLA